MPDADHIDNQNFLIYFSELYKNFLNKATNYYKNSQLCSVLWLVLALNNSWQQKLQLEFSACQKFSDSMFLFTLVTLSAISQKLTIAFTQPFKPIREPSLDRFSNLLSFQLHILSCTFLLSGFSKLSFGFEKVEKMSFNLKKF